MIRYIKNGNLLLGQLDSGKAWYMYGNKRPDTCFLLNYRTNLYNLFEFLSLCGDYQDLLDDCLNDPECEGMGTNGDWALDKGPNQTIFLFDGLDRELQEKIDKGIDADWTKEPYDFMDDSNSICMQEENFIDCLKKWDWIKRNKPQYVLFWRKKVGDDVLIETFEQEYEVNKRIEELETIVAN